MVARRAFTPILVQQRSVEATKPTRYMHGRGLIGVVAAVMSVVTLVVFMQRRSDEVPSDSYRVLSEIELQQSTPTSSIELPNLETPPTGSAESPPEAPAQAASGPIASAEAPPLASNYQPAPPIERRFQRASNMPLEERYAEFLNPEPTVVPIIGQNITICNTMSIGWWLRISKGDWEISTLQLIQSLSAPGKVVLDLGSWLGVTPMVAALAGATVYAFDADPTAFAELTCNIAQNPELDARISLQPWCIGNDNVIVNMRGNPGHSASSIMPKLKDEFGSDWNATCYRLPYIVQELGIPTRDISLIKMDIEGAEAYVLPDIADWVAEIGYPPIAIGIHSFAWEAIREVQTVLKTVFERYKYVYDNRYNLLRPSDLDPILISDGSFVLTNEPLSIAEMLAAAAAMGK